MPANLVAKAVLPVLAAASLLLASGCGGGNSSDEKAGAPASATSTAASEPKPLGPSDVLAGTATVTPPAGPAGKLAVVTVGRDSGVIETYFPVVVRNNTSDAVSHVDMAVTAKDAAGKVIGSGASQHFAPQDIESGEASLAYVYFANKLPRGTKFDFSFDSQPPSTDPFAMADLKVNQANHRGSHIVGIATNTKGKTLQGPFSVAVFCFTPAGRLTTTQATFANGPDSLAANKTVSYDIDLVYKPCSTFLVGSSGFFK
jgi:hypothetical protein